MKIPRWLMIGSVFPFLFLAVSAEFQRAVAEEKPDRPNIVWIISDDLSPELGCYGYEWVSTPNLDRLAKNGIRYTNAFSTSPVCSASRTAFQTGFYQTTIGGHHHNTRVKPELGASVPTLVGLMRDAGYFVCNGRAGALKNSRLAKTHFNFVYDKNTFFDGSDWSKRGKSQPFFAQIQIKEPHRDFEKTSGPRPGAKIPPYYPEHEIVRTDWEYYLTSIETMDALVGGVLKRLDDEGLSDNTIVMFFGDHGRPHARDKQWLYDGGTRVPLLIRWPEKTIGGKGIDGTVNEQLTSLLDLVPTTLAAASVETPANLLYGKYPGGNLFDSNWKGHQLVFAARDRCGDAPDRVRSVRSKDFKYIRNFHPERPYLQLSSYKKLQYPTETVMKVLHQQGDWSSPFMAKEKPEEELYDLRVDPFEMNNLVGNFDHEEVLVRMRKSLDDWIKETNDRGADDESETVDMSALMKEKRKWYEKTMKSRGLDPDLSDYDYMKWWEKKLGAD